MIGLSRYQAPRPERLIILSTKNELIKIYLTYLYIYKVLQCIYEYYNMFTYLPDQFDINRHQQHKWMYPLSNLHRLSQRTEGNPYNQP